MTPDRIKELLKQAGGRERPETGLTLLGGIDFGANGLAEFVRLVQAAEREVCAKLVTDWNTAITDKIADEIRARGSQS